MFPIDIQRSFYNPAQDNGFWSPSSSLANFCEEDYVITRYIAEFINTLSNAAYVYYAIRPPVSGLRPLLENQSGGAKTKLNGHTRWDLPSVALVLVGVSSALYHATQSSFWQWFDDSSMYLLAASWIQTLLTSSYASGSLEYRVRLNQQFTHYSVTHHNQWLTFIVLSTTLALSTVATHITGVLAIHSITFALLLIVSGVKLLRLLMAATQQSAPRSMQTSGLSGMSKSRGILLNSMMRSILFLCVGFTLWLVDCNPRCCEYLRYLRNDVLANIWYLRPLAFLTELHGWWHILTARAAGEYIMLVRILTTSTKHTKYYHALPIDVASI